MMLFVCASIIGGSFLLANALMNKMQAVKAKKVKTSHSKAISGDKPKFEFKESQHIWDTYMSLPVENRVFPDLEEMLTAADNYVFTTGMYTHTRTSTDEARRISHHYWCVNAMRSFAELPARVGFYDDDREFSTKFCISCKKHREILSAVTELASAVAQREEYEKELTKKAKMKDAEASMQSYASVLDRIRLEAEAIKQTNEEIYGDDNE